MYLMTSHYLISCLFITNNNINITLIDMLYIVHIVIAIYAIAYLINIFIRKF